LGPIDATAKALEQECRSLAERARTLQEQHVAFETKSSLRKKEALELNREAEQRRTAVEAAVDRWKKLGGEGECLDTTSAPWLEREAATAEAEAKDIDAIEGELTRLRDAARKARGARDAAIKDVEAARGALDRAEAALRDAKARLEKGSADKDAQAERVKATLESLERPLADVPAWREDVERDAAAFRDRWSRLVAEAAKQVEAEAHAKRALDEIAGKVEVATSKLGSAKQQRSVLASERAQQASELEELRAQRSKLLGGLAVAQVEQSMQAALREREQVHAKADRQARQSKGEADKRSGEYSQARAALETATRQAGEAAKELADQLREAGLDAGLLRERLARDASWIDSERAALAAVDQELATRTRFAEAARQELAAHRAQGAPDLPREVVAGKLAELEPLHATQNQELGAKRHQLAQDDANRAEGLVRARELEKERSDALVWQQLGQLIGSADGQRFRVFAQSLTMETLLAQANVELKSLAPRYVLQRVASQDLEIQVVDRDMGDEVRSTASLSGGESFLVSLALALGLSSLASETVRIESLFIDEGFGALDPQALEHALSTLDALQSSGRQVGLISHVPGLAERIGVQVQVQPRGNGASTVTIVAGGA
jgi:exonuclease SbcC